MDLRAFALSMSRPLPSPERKRGVCISCGGGTYKGHSVCARCARSQALATRRSAGRDPVQPRPLIPCWICGKLITDRPRAEGRQPTCNPCTKKYGAGVCSECGGPMRIAKSSAPPDRRRCRTCQCQHPRPKLDLKVCELCECTYTPRYYPRPGQQQRWCSKSCAQAWRNGARPPYTRVIDGDGESQKMARRRLRLRVHAETWDGVTDAEILERDRWRCGICRKVIGKSFKYPHPRSASIDHVIPVSQGGDDTAANRRAAHLSCNQGRMNRGGGEQLAMIG